MKIVAINANGLTLSQWAAAARLSRNSKVAEAGWRGGYDPSDYRAEGSARRGGVKVRVVKAAGPKITLTKVRMDTRRGMTAYAKDGRYFGARTSNYDFEVDFGGNTRIEYGTIDAHDKASARAKLLKKFTR